MNRHRPFYYRRIRLFCELSIDAVAWATGVRRSAVAAIEVGKRTPNDTEKRAIERYLRDRLTITFETDGPVPDWVRPSEAALTEGLGE